MKVCELLLYITHSVFSKLEGIFLIISIIFIANLASSQDHVQPLLNNLVKEDALAQEESEYSTSYYYKMAEGSKNIELSFDKTKQELRIDKVGEARNQAMAIPIDQVRGLLTIDGNAENNTLTIHSSFFELNLDVVFDGLGQESPIGDALVISGGTFTNVTLDYLDHDEDGFNGIVALDAAHIEFRGLEPVLVNVGAVDHVIFNLPNGNNPDVLLKNNSNAGENELTGSTFETTVFVNPLSSLTINAGSGTDIIALETLDAAFDADLNINADVTDKVTLQSTNTQLISGDLDITAEVINLMADITTTGDITLEGLIGITGVRMLSATDVTFDGPIYGGDAGNPTNMEGDLTVTGTGTTTFNWQIGYDGTTEYRLSSLLTNGGGTTVFQRASGSIPDIRVQGDVQFDDAVLCGAIHIMRTAGSMTFNNTWDGAVDRFGDIIIYVGVNETLSFNKPVGGTARLRGLQIAFDGKTLINTTIVRVDLGLTYYNDAEINPPGASSTFMESDNGPVSFRKTLRGTIDGEDDLVVSANNMDFRSFIGDNNQRLKNLTISDTNSVGAMKVVGNVDFQADIQLSGDLTQLDGTGLTSFNGGSIGDDISIKTATILLESSNLACADAITFEADRLITESGASSTDLTAATVHSMARLSPGDTLFGQLVLDGNLTTSSGDIVHLAIKDQGNPGETYDQITCDGTIDITGAVLDLVDSIPGASPLGYFTLIDNDLADAVIGSFSGYPQGSTFTFNGDTWMIDYQGGDGNDVVIVYNLAPIATCQDITLYLNDEGYVTIQPSDVDGGSSDADGTIMLSIDQDSFICTDVGSNTVTLTVEDDDGATATCHASVTVRDTTAPVCITQDITVYLDAGGMASIAHDSIDNGSSDNCGAVTLASSKTTFSCSDMFAPPADNLVITGAYDGPLTGGTPKGVELYVLVDIPDLSLYGLGSANNGGGTDGEEFTFPNVAATAGTYIYVASEATEFTNFFGFAPDYTSGSMLINGDDAVELFYNGSVIDVFGDINADGSGMPWDYLDGWVYRNNNTGPDGTTFVLSNWTFSGINVFDGETTNGSAAVPFPIGTYSYVPSTPGPIPVILTVTDGSGNASTCTASVSVLDTVSPVVSCQDITVYLDENGAASITPADVDSGSMDVCSPINLSLDQMTFSCSDVVANDAILMDPDDENYAEWTPKVYGTTGILEVITTCSNSSGSGNVFSIDCTNGYREDLFNSSPGFDDTQMVLDDDAAGSSARPQVLCFESPAMDLSAGGKSFAFDYQNETYSISGFSTAEAFNGMSWETLWSVDVDARGAVALNLEAFNNADFQVRFCYDDENFFAWGAAFDNVLVSARGSVPVTLTATDSSGNSTTCVSSVLVRDTFAPVAMCHDVSIYEDASGMAVISSADSAEIVSGTTDNCGTFMTDFSQSSFDCMAGSTYQILVTYSDVAGNTDTCSAEITVIDTFPPQLSCSDIVVYLDTVGQYVLNAQDSADLIGFLSDGCAGSDVSVDFERDTFYCSDITPILSRGFCVGTMITLTATDGSGNSSTCTACVDVRDTIPPIALCQDITVNLDQNGMASITFMQVDSGSTDNCEMPNLSLSKTSFTCMDVGMNTVILTASDNSGNMSTCSSTVTVIDMTEPTPFCNQNVNITLEEDGTVVVKAKQFDISSTDNCTDPADLRISFSGSDVNDSLRTLTCADLGFHAIQIFVWDESNNVLGCNAGYTLIDLYPPDPMCSNISVYLDENGVQAISPADSAVIVGGTTEACGDITSTFSPSTFSCSDIGSPVDITVTYSDGSNTSSCTSTVTVLDTMPPSPVCNDISVYVDANGEVYLSSLDSANVVAGTTDNCSDFTATVDKTYFTCGSGIILPPPLRRSSSQSGSIVVTYTDIYGNSDTCTAMVTILDTFPPVQDCNNFLTVYLDTLGQYILGASDSATLVGSTYDVCDGDGFTASFSQDTFGCDDIAVLRPARGGCPYVEVLVTVTDSSGNSSACLSCVRVSDTLAPAAKCNDITVSLDAAGNYTLSEADSLAMIAGTFDNCGLFTASLSLRDFSCVDINSPISVDITYKDDFNNTSTCTSMVTVKDVTIPVVSCKNVNVLLDANGEFNLPAAFLLNPSSFDGCSGSLTASYSPTDNNDNMRVIDCSYVGTVATDVPIYIWDESGNMTTCVAGVLADDNITPTAMCHDITVTLGVNGSYKLTNADSAVIVAGSSDNCEDFTVALSKTKFDCGDEGVNSVDVTVTDQDGNSDLCMAMVTVIRPPSMLFNWTGQISTDWNDGDNWSTGCVPGEFDDVFIKISPNIAVISTGDMVKIRTLDVELGADLICDGELLVEN